MNLGFSPQILEKHSNMKATSWKSVEGKPSFSKRADGRRDRYDEAYSRFCTFGNAPKNQSAHFPPLGNYDARPVFQNHYSGISLVTW